jgi:sugar/nucleoside kinase (ribokinase family)
MTVVTDAIDCVVCGTCVADVLVRPVPLEEPVGGGRLFHVDPLTVTTGGLVCNTGVAMRRLGATVAAAAIVGDDLWGREIRSRLTAEGVAGEAVEVHPGAATSTTAALIDPGGERSFAHHVGAGAEVDLGFLSRHARLFSRCRYAVLGYVGLLPAIEPHLAEAVGMLRAAGCSVVLETAAAGGSLADLAAALPHVDIFVPSLEEGRRHAGTDNPSGIIAAYRRLGATGLVGVKCGVRGVHLSPLPGSEVHVRSVTPPGVVVDTTGAGDAFLAGLIVGLCRGLPVEEAGSLGAAAAACCVTKAGATAGIRDLDATLALARA